MEHCMIRIIIIPQCITKKVECKRDNQKQPYRNQQPGIIAQIIKSGNFAVYQRTPAYGRITDAQSQIRKRCFAHDKTGNTERNTDNQKTGYLRYYMEEYDHC